jgi:hypothetical protein
MVRTAPSGRKGRRNPLACDLPGSENCMYQDRPFATSRVCERTLMAAVKSGRSYYPQAP